MLDNRGRNHFLRQCTYSRKKENIFLIISGGHFTETAHPFTSDHLFWRAAIEGHAIPRRKAQQFKFRIEIGRKKANLLLENFHIAVIFGDKNYVAIGKILQQ